jgi:hypothetical protein
MRYTTLCDTGSLSLTCGMFGDYSVGTLVSSTNKIERYEIAEIVQQTLR